MCRDRFFPCTAARAYSPWSVLPVLVVAVILVALSRAGKRSQPQRQLAIIFGLVGGFVFLLLIVQGMELRSASSVRTKSLAPGT